MQTENSITHLQLVLHGNIKYISVCPHLGHIEIKQIEFTQPMNDNTN